MVSLYHTRPLPCEAQNNRLWVDGNKGNCPNWGCCGPSLFIALALRSCHIWGNETTHWLISILYEYAWLGPSSLGGMSLHCLAFRTNSNIFHAQVWCALATTHSLSRTTCFHPRRHGWIPCLRKGEKERDLSSYVFKFCDPFQIHKYVFF